MYTEKFLGVASGLKITKKGVWGHSLPDADLFILMQTAFVAIFCVL